MTVITNSDSTSRMVKRRLNTIDELIDAFKAGDRSGEHELAEFLGISVNAILNWRLRGYIPNGWHLRLYLEAQRRGWTIAPEVFDLQQEYPHGFSAAALVARGNGVARA